MSQTCLSRRDGPSDTILHEAFYIEPPGLRRARRRLPRQSRIIRVCLQTVGGRPFQLLRCLFTDLPQCRGNGLSRCLSSMLSSRDAPSRFRRYGRTVLRRGVSPVRTSPCFSNWCAAVLVDIIPALAWRGPSTSVDSYSVPAGIRSYVQRDDFRIRTADVVALSRIDCGRHHCNPCRIPINSIRGRARETIERRKRLDRATSEALKLPGMSGL